MTTITCIVNNVSHILPFYITNINNTTIIGLSICLKLKLFTINCNTTNECNPTTIYEVSTTNIISPSIVPMRYSMQTLIDQFPGRFRGLGLFPGTLNIHIDEVLCL